MPDADRSLEWLRDVAAEAEDDAGSVQQLLHAVRTQLGMDVAWTSEFVGTEQVFRFVDAAPGADGPKVGESSPLSGSYCARVLDGRLPALIPDSRHEPATALLDVTAALHIGAYLGVPLMSAEGVVSGMLCATSRGSMPGLSERDLQTLRLLAQLLHDLQLRALDTAQLAARKEQLRAELECVIGGQGRWAVLQPIVSATTGDVVAQEGLSRFDSDLTPAQWFDAAARAGLCAELELAAARTVLAALDDGVPAVCVNLSPATVITGDLAGLLADVDPARVVVEITEHQQVADYDALRQALAPWRARGLRLAVDDAGAGYASLQHVLMCAPDLVKLDMALVRGVDGDPVRRALVAAVLQFAAAAGIEVVAEGVETEAERDALVELGVPLLQGFFLGRPADRAAVTRSGDVTG
jgi:EAL domain-containing protein (putative c-di-GMP-specific phosphodiesterase class I)